MYTYSDEHIKYIKKEKQKKRIVIISQISIIIFLIAIWELLAQLNIINTFLSSSPSNIVNTIIKLFNDNNLFNHIHITLYETILSFIIAFVIGISFATLLWWNKTIAKIFDPYLTILNSLPKVALGPLIIIWVGANTNSIICMALMISAIITIINIYNGFENIDGNYIKLMKSLNATKRQIYLKLVLPSNKINIINTLKINISMSLIGLLPPVGENFIV